MSRACGGLHSRSGGRSKDGDAHASNLLHYHPLLDHLLPGTMPKQAMHRLQSTLLLLLGVTQILPLLVHFNVQQRANRQHAVRTNTLVAIPKNMQVS